MSTVSRRTFIGSTAAVAAAEWSRPARAQIPEKLDTSGETLSRADAPWAPTRVLDTEKMAWEATAIWKRKVLAWDFETNAHLLLLYVPPGWDGGANHYHLWHEWAYVLAGDLTNNEYMTPEQRVGALMQFREGHFLDRPAYSLHGSEPGRLSSQIGGFLIIQEEGMRSVSVAPGTPFASDEYKSVKAWAMPRIVDTIGNMLWEDDPTVKGLKVKPLADDPGRGFRAMLRWMPPGWSAATDPGFAAPHYYKQARQFNFVLVGDMRLQPYRTPERKAQEIALKKYFLFDRRPNAVCGLADGKVTEEGCIWIEVTYAKGMTVSDTPIEAPIRV